MTIFFWVGCLGIQNVLLKQFEEVDATERSLNLEQFVSDLEKARFKI